MRVALAQINPIVGNYDYNVEKIIAFVRRAGEHGADMVLFPEMALCGYPAMDLWQQQSFIDGATAALQRLCTHSEGVPFVVVGHIAPPVGAERRPRNTVSVLHARRIVFQQAKTALPNYDIFDEERYFSPAREWGLFEGAGKRIGIAICEDIWTRGPSAARSLSPVERLMEYTPDVICIPAASPYFHENMRQRFALLQEIARRYGVTVFYVNCVGANDAVLFDGHSAVINGRGELAHLSPGFVEDCSVVSTEGVPPRRYSFPPRMEAVRAALVMGIRDYVHKTSHTRVHVGLSGGIDSAVVLALAVEALGSGAVRAICMPSEYTSEESREDATEVAARLGVGYTIIEIDTVREALHAALGPVAEGRLHPMTLENIQARIRGVLLMAYSNNSGSLTLVTGNKSELATGYATLYGDTAGALAVIGDLYKSEVYELVAAINRDHRVIPSRVVHKAPSAELRPHQQDSDTLPPYPLLDRVLRLVIEGGCSASEIIERGYQRAVVERVVAMVKGAEYKRAQYPPVLKVSARAFGSGRRLPIVRG